MIWAGVVSRYTEKNRVFFQNWFFGLAKNRKPKKPEKVRETGKNTKNRGEKAQTPLISNPQIALDSSYTPSSVTAGTNQMCRWCMYLYSGFDSGCIARHVLILDLILVRTKIS